MFCNCYFNYAADQEMVDYVQPFLDAEFPGKGKEFIGALYYGSNGTSHIHSFLATSGFNFVMFVSMKIIAFCTVSISLHFRNPAVEWSDSTKEQQRRLFHILLAQTIFPMLFVFFPCAAIINLPLLGFRINVFPNLVSAALTVFPLVNAFIIIFGVDSYRNAVLSFLKCKKPKSEGGIVFTSVDENMKETVTVYSYKQ